MKIEKQDANKLSNLVSVLLESENRKQSNQIGEILSSSYLCNNFKPHKVFMIIKAIKLKNMPKPYFS